MIWPLPPVIERIGCCLILIEIPINLLRIVSERDHKVKQERKLGYYSIPEHHVIEYDNDAWTIDKLKGD